MNVEQQLVLKMMHNAIEENSVEFDFDRDADMNMLIHLSMDQSVFLLIYPEISKHLQSGKLKRHYLNELHNMISLEANSKAVLGVFIGEGIQFIPLKGIVYKELYPNPESRQMGDLDVLVAHKDLKRASDLLLSLGYSEMMGHEESDHHVVFYNVEKGTVELHHALMDYRRHRGDVAAFENSIWTRTKASRVCGFECECIGHVDTLIYMMLHMAAHFLMAGLGIKQILDFVLYSKCHDKEIDWQEFWNAADHFGVHKLAVCVSYIGNVHFGAQIEVDELEVDRDAVENLMDDIWKSGDNGKTIVKNAAGSVFLKDPYQQADGAWTSNIWLLMKHFSVEANKQYPKISKYKILMPFLLCRFFMKRIGAKGGGGFGAIRYAARSVGESKRRYDLAKSMKLR